MDKNVIEIKDVSFRYQEDAGLSLAHVNLQVREGKVIVLCGASGCGKSTFVRCFCGLEKKPKGFWKKRAKNIKPPKDLPLLFLSCRM